MRRWLEAAAGYLGVLLLAWALFWVVRQERFHWALHRQDYASAVRIWPQQESGWAGLSDAEREKGFPRQALNSARRAATLVPSDWEAWSRLAGLQWQLQQPRQARASMERMAAVARSYEAHWQYANLLLLSNDTAGFWNEIVRALALAKDFDIEPSLMQCANVAGNEHRDLLVQVVGRAIQLAPDRNQRALLAQNLLEFTSQRGWWPEAAAAWRLWLDAGGGSSDAASPTARAYLTVLVRAQRRLQARAVWESCRRLGVLPAAAGPPPGQMVTDGDFDRPPDDSPLAWDLCTDCGPRVFLTSLTPALAAGVPGSGHALEIDFSGTEPANLQLARQSLLLQPSTRYHLHASSTRLDPNPQTGLSLLVVNETAVCAHLNFPAGGGLVPNQADFTTSPDPAGSYDLQLIYQRPVGQVLLQGSVLLTSVSLRPLPAAPQAGAPSPHPCGEPLARLGQRP